MPRNTPKLPAPLAAYIEKHGTEDWPGVPSPAQELTLVTRQGDDLFDQDLETFRVGHLVCAREGKNTHLKYEVLGFTKREQTIVLKPWGVGHDGLITLIHATGEGLKVVRNMNSGDDTQGLPYANSLITW